MIRAWCEQLPAGAHVEDILRLADSFLDSQAGLTVELLVAAHRDEQLRRPIDEVIDAVIERLDQSAAAELRGSANFAESVAQLLTAGWTAEQINDALLQRELRSADAGDAVLAWRAKRLADTVAKPRGKDDIDRASVIRRADGRAVRVDPFERRYSTPELLALERRLVNAAVSRRHADVAIVPSDVLNAAITRRPSLSTEQAAMVRRLTTSGRGVEIVVGKAGAGKTFALDAARDAWQTSGIRVVGAALAARAAAELHAGAGIDSYTIDALLADFDREHGGLVRGSVLVVDEAGMVGTRKLSRLLDRASKADAKVVLVGDHRQLPEIDTGGVFRGLLHRLEPVRLDINRRQRQQWERAALDELRAGDPAQAMTAYRDQGALVLGDTAEQVRERLVSDWWAAYEQQGPDAGVMIAARLSDVDDLNGRARHRLAEASRLHGAALVVDDRRYQAGDRIVALHNDRRVGVVNGTRATVTAINLDERSLVAETDGGTTVTLPAPYLDAGHVAHAYAVTAHKAQGLTTERTWVLGSDEIYREWGYVAMSRGRESNRMYIVAGADIGQDGHCHVPHTPGADEVADLARALERSRAQALAIDHGTVDATPGPNRERLAMLLAGAPRDRVQELQWIAEERDAALDQLREAQQRHDGVTRQLRKLDGSFKRVRNLGAVEQIHGQQRRAANDVARWQQRLDDIDRRTLALQAEAERRETWQQAHATDVAQAHELLTADAAVVRQKAQASEFRSSPYVIAAVGARPVDPTERRAWRAAVLEIERYRHDFGVDDETYALGPPPADAHQRAARVRVEQAIRGVDVAREQVLTHDVDHVLQQSPA